jgi:hypothetical protein
MATLSSSRTGQSGVGASAGTPGRASVSKAAPPSPGGGRIKGASLNLSFRLRPALRGESAEGDCVSVKG